MTGAVWGPTSSDRRGSANAALACELVDKLCEPAKLLVKEEFAMVAMRLNMEFLACASAADVAECAAVVFHHKPAVIAAIHSAIQEGDACVHILLDLCIHLTYSASASDTMLECGLVDTLVAVLPVLTAGGDAPTFSLLQLLDRLTDNDDDDNDPPPPPPRSSDRCRRRRLAAQRLCRVACVRVLWNVLASNRDSTGNSDSPRSSSRLSPTGPALSLLDKITAAVMAAVASGRPPKAAAAVKQVVSHTLQREPTVEATLTALIVKGAEGHDAGQRSPHDQRAIGVLLARVHRWRHANT